MVFLRLGAEEMVWGGELLLLSPSWQKPLLRRQVLEPRGREIAPPLGDGDIYAGIYVCNGHNCSRDDSLVDETVPLPR